MYDRFSQNVQKFHYQKSTWMNFSSLLFLNTISVIIGNKPYNDLGEKMVSIQISMKIHLLIIVDPESMHLSVSFSTPRQVSTCPVLRNVFPASNPLSHQRPKLDDPALPTEHWNYRWYRGLPSRGEDPLMSYPHPSIKRYTGRWGW